MSVQVGSTFPMAKPKRVLITFDTHTPYLAFRVRELKREIDARGLTDQISLEVVLVALAETTYQWQAGELSKLYGGVSVRVLTDKFRGLGFQTWFRWTTVKTTAALAWHYLKLRPHVSFVGGYDRPESMVLALLSIFTRGRVGVLHDSRFNDAESYAKNITLEWMKSLMMKRYDFFMCPGRECVEYSRFLGGARKPAYLGGWDIVDNEEIGRLAEKPHHDAEIREHLGVGDGGGFFFMPIRFLPKKNAAMVIAAFAACRGRLSENVSLVLCGQGPLEADYRKQIADLGMEKNILLRPWLPYHLVPRANRLALSLVLASTHDQWGMTVNEALAAGGAVLCSSRAGAHEVVQNHVNGFTFHPWDQDHLTALFEALTKDEELVDRLRSNAVASLRNFSVRQWLEACFAAMEI